MEGEYGGLPERGKAVAGHSGPNAGRGLVGSRPVYLSRLEEAGEPPYFQRATRLSRDSSIRS